jgi:hypothetical protein
VDEEHLFVTTPDGRLVLIGCRRDLPATLPNGERRYVRHTTLVPDARGALMHPDDPRLVQCHLCEAFPLRADSTRMCAACLATICLGCAVPVPDPDAEQPRYLCVHCARHANRQALFHFFFSI